MDRMRHLLGVTPEQQYEPVEDTSDDDRSGSQKQAGTFSWITYSIFLLLGVSMLWAWNMFLAANPYFQHRFASSKSILDNFQSSILAASTIANLGTMLVLARKQIDASYSRRIVVSILISISCFVLLALSAVAFTNVSPAGYLVFVLIVVFVASVGTGMIQNGVYAYVQGFSEPRYTQGIMVGQAVAGVLPCFTQIISVQAARVDGNEKAPSKDDTTAHAALSYFLVAVAVSTITLFAFAFLRRRKPTVVATLQGTSAAPRRQVAMRTLFMKLKWHSIAIFFCFSLTMVYPVYTQSIVSVRKPENTPPLLQKDSFIPLSLLIWNIGDLSGRVITAVPFFSRSRYPRLVLGVSLARVIFIPLYHLCNLDGKGAVVKSDVFYLFVVQLGFGLTNGWVGSTCMMAPAEYVDDDEKEVAGGYMGLILVAGLSVGSFASFLVAGS